LNCLTPMYRVISSSTTDSSSSNSSSSMASLFGNVSPQARASSSAKGINLDDILEDVTPLYVAYPQKPQKGLSRRG
ncbi:unnamed protein product, partial [Ilex paraguariensis]